MRRKGFLIALLLLLVGAEGSLAPESFNQIPAEYQASWLMGWPGALGLGDLKANYPGYFYKVDPSVEMVIQGEFPRCRYISYVAHDIQNRVIGTLHDSEIAPDPGSINPFLPGADWNAPNRKYTIIIRFTPPPPGKGPEVVRGMQAARGNIIYVGAQADGSPNPGGLLAYRRYLPSQGYDFNGGVPMPVIYYRRVSDGSLVKPPISNMQQYLFFIRAFSSGIKNAIKSREWSNRAFGREQKEAVQWHRSPVVGAENPDTVYVIAKIKPRKDKLLVFRWKAPTFPDTYHNKGITGKEDVRYWSMCFAPATTMTVFTLADVDAVISQDGFVNLVVGFGAEKPAKVKPENGYTWVDLKGKNIRFLLYRNMVVSPEFKFSARDVPAGELVIDQIGDYLPRAKWVSSEDF